MVSHMPATSVPSSHLYAVIPAGGVGSRLWPLSRASEPKFLLDLTGTGRSLLRATVDRVLPLVGADHVLVVTGRRHREAVAAQLPDVSAEHIVAENEPRDSSAAIGLAAALLVQHDPDAIMASLPADHVIGDEPTFRAALQDAASVAATGRLVTIGVTPSRPATGFGYIRFAEALTEPAGTTAHAVTQFVEKPRADVAESYLRSGDYLWNAGMFVARAADLLAWLAQTQPALVDGVTEIAEAWHTDERQRVVDRVWPTLARIAIDYSVAEPVAARGQVAVIPAHFDWDDVGDFSAVARQVRRHQPGNLAILGDAQVLSEGSTGVLVSETDRLIALIGVQDLVVVDTDDVLLVTTGDNTQRVKEMVEMVRQTGNDGLL